MKVSKTTLKNGVRVITVPKKESQAVTVAVLVAAGSKYEDKSNSGISHFLEHMCFKGTTNRPRSIDISAELDSLGANYNAFTTQEYTSYYATVWPKHFEKAVEIVADMYLNPVFDPKEIDKERGVIIEEMNMYEDMPRRDVQDLFLKLLYKDQPAGWPIIGTKDVIQKITADDFRKYREANYVAKATTIVISGKITEAAALKLVDKYFGQISRNKKAGKEPTKEKQTKPETLLKYKKSDQSHLVIGFRAFDLFDKRSTILDVLATVLGGSMSSRLFQKIREELGAAYYVRAAHEALSDHGFLEVAVGADTTRVPQIIEAVLGECNRLKEELVSPQELRRVKDYIIGNLYLELETSDHLAFYYGIQELLKRKIETPEQFAAKIEKVTAKQIQQLANEIFVNEGLNLAAVGPHQDQNQFARVLTI